MNRLRPLFLRLSPLLMASALLLQTRPVLGEGAGEWAVGIAPSYVFIVLGRDVEPDGGGAAFYVQYALTEALSMRLWGMWTGHDVEPAGEKDPGGLYQVINAALVLCYAFDLVTIRPTLDAGVGVLHQLYQGEEATSLGIQLGVGVDYRPLRLLAVGIAFHYHAFLSDPATYPVYFDAGPRLTFYMP